LTKILGRQDSNL